MWRDLDPHKSPSHYPAHLQAVGLGYAGFPPDLYERGERPSKELMEHGVIVPVARVSKVGDMTIATIRVDVPAGDWRNTPMTSLTSKLRELGQRTPQEIAHRQAKQWAAEKKSRFVIKEYQTEKAR